MEMRAKKPWLCTVSGYRISDGYFRAPRVGLSKFHTFLKANLLRKPISFRRVRVSSQNNVVSIKALENPLPCIYFTTISRDWLSAAHSNDKINESRQKLFGNRQRSENIRVSANFIQRYLL